MSDLVPWGYGGVQLAQQYQMNQQLMRARDVGIQQAQQDLDASQQEQQINQQAASMFQTLAKGGTIPGASTNPADEAGSPAEAFDKVASTMLNIGQPNKALDYFKAASTLRKSQNEAVAALTKQQQAKYDLLYKQADLIGRDLGGATNADEWNQGVQSMQEQAAAGIIPKALADQVKNLPYTPELAAHFRNSALSVKDKANLDMQAQRAAMTEDAQRQTQNYRDQRLALDRQKVEDARIEREKKEKTGASASAPTTAQIKEAEGVVTSVIFNGNAPDPYLNKEDKATDSKTLSYQAYQAGVTAIANQANQMLKENRGLTRQEALNRAALASKASGDWETITEKGGWFDADSTTTSFNSAGKQPEDAMPMPMNNNTPDMSRLKAGRWYTYGSTTFRYDGDGKASVIK